MGPLQFGSGGTAPAHGDGREVPYEAIWPGLVRRLTAITRDPDLAEEVSQEALVRLTLAVRAGRRPVNLAAWLTRVGLNLAISHGRRSRVAARRAHQLVAVVVPGSPEDRVVEREQMTVLRRVLAELEPDDRLLLILSASGHSGVEIAGRVGMSHTCVRTRLHRLRGRLRARLAQLEAA